MPFGGRHSPMPGPRRFSPNANRPAPGARIRARTHEHRAGGVRPVHPSCNSRYHALIEAFFGQTGVPMELNTPCNENEPVVCRPEEALDCFLRTKMDLLILGNHVVRRRFESAR